MPNGRVESRFTIPTGGAAVSASTGAHTAAIVVTVPAANYFMTEAGGVDGLLATFETQLNENVQGYPLSADAMRATVGGAWSTGGGNGWLMNEVSGNLVPVFGTVTLTAASLTYQVAGPRGGIDKAISFTSGASQGVGTAATFDVSATDDLVAAWVAFVPAALTSGQNRVFVKAGGAYYTLDFYGAAGNVQIDLHDGVDGLSVGAGAGSALRGEWHVGMLVLERATNTARIATKGLTSGTAFTSANTSAALIGSLANAGNFVLGSITAQSWQLAALYITEGNGVGTGLSANLATAVTNFANAVNATWSASLSTSDGRVTIANSHWPSSVAFTNTTLRDAIGFAYSFDYPQTATEVRAATGNYGTFVAGYLCNETAGNAASVFGTPSTLTASGTPVYSNQGARGGNDKALGLDSVTDQFNGGDVWNVGATDDIGVLWVGKFTSVPVAFGNMFSRTAAAFANGWTVFHNDTGTLSFGAGASGVYRSNLVGSAVFNAGEWHVGCAVIDRSTGKIRIAVHNLTTGVQTLGTEAAIVNAVQVAGAFQFGNSAWIQGTSVFQCSAFYVMYGLGACTGMSANISTVLTNFATHMKSQTGTDSAKFVWLPDSALSVAEGDPKRAPVVSDLRTSMSPSGNVLGLVGNRRRYRHRGLSWPLVPLNRVWEREAAYPNNSWETFFKDTQLGDDAWCNPCSPIQIYDHNGFLVGVDANGGTGVAGWQIIGVSSIDDAVKRFDPQGWTGLWRITLPEIASSG